MCNGDADRQAGQGGTQNEQSHQRPPGSGRRRAGQVPGSEEKYSRGGTSGREAAVTESITKTYP